MLQILVAAFFILETLALPIVLKRDDGGIWDYPNHKIRGVNLGGWFVLEAYITPSLFQAFGDDPPVDEYHYTQTLGKKEAWERLNNHWDTWYTEGDFQSMVDLGLNAVRIPIGYWAFVALEGDPYVQGQIAYLDRAISWARKYGLKVWVDLHGAPGSQNGFDNSGLRDSYDFQKGNNVEITLQVLKQIGDKYGSSDYYDVIIGIEILNEPLGSVFNMTELKDFYYKAYDQLRWSDSSQIMVMHDAFQEIGYWNDVLTWDGGGYWSVLLDHHHYQWTSGEELNRTIEEHVEVACELGPAQNNESHWAVTGEFSAAMTDCALWLNGVGRGARFSGDYDNTPYIDSCASYTELENWSDEYKTNVRKFVEAQFDSYEQNGGWFFWNWKCEDAPEWNFQKLAAANLIPNPLTDRQFPNQCNY